MRTSSRKRSVVSMTLSAVSAAVLASSVLCPVAAAAASPLSALMPMPRSVQPLDGALRLEGLPTITVEGCRSAIVDHALKRFTSDVRTLTGAALIGRAAPLRIRCAAADPNLLSIEAKEAYRLEVSGQGVRIDADGETGVLRALATLRQLLVRDADGPTIPFVRIEDSPRFVWRGLMIDTARHFMGVAAIKRQIDAMELAKLNVLHLHLSDNEGFRVESRRFPRLTERSGGQFYTQAEIRDLVNYAGDRAIRIVPEFDMPGHSLALVQAYPELVATPIDPADPLIKSKGVLNPASASTYRFLRDFFAEITPLFPDRYFHIGGDEVSDVAWAGNADVEALKRREKLAGKSDVEAWFHQRVRRLLDSRGKVTIGWDETADHALPKEAVVQVWRTSNPIHSATARGNRVIVSAGYYLDQLRPADVLYGIDPFDTMAYQTMSQQELAGVRRNPVAAAQVSDGLAGRPTPPLSPEQQGLVLGGEAPLWAEIVSEEMLDGRLWPRALALAERFWSPAASRDPISMYARLVPALDGLRALGLRDATNRERMVARLAPSWPDPVRELVGLVAPVRMFAHMKPSPPGGTQELIELADAASTDGSPARRFRVAVDRYLAGDRTQTTLLRSMLTGWRDNLTAYRDVAQGRPLLLAAIPTAEDVSTLGQLGLSALDAQERGTPMTQADRTASQSLFPKLKQYEAASSSIGAMAVLKQPPADLIILIWSDVQRLVEAAGVTTDAGDRSAPPPGAGRRP